MSSGVQPRSEACAGGCCVPPYILCHLLAGGNEEDRADRVTVHAENLRQFYTDACLIARTPSPKSHIYWPPPPLGSSSSDLSKRLSPRLSSSVRPHMKLKLSVVPCFASGQPFLHTGSIPCPASQDDITAPKRLLPPPQPLQQSPQAHICSSGPRWASHDLSLAY